MAAPEVSRGGRDENDPMGRRFTDVDRLDVVPGLF